MALRDAFVLGRLRLRLPAPAGRHQVVPDHPDRDVDQRDVPADPHLRILQVRDQFGNDRRTELEKVSEDLGAHVAGLQRLHQTRNGPLPELLERKSRRRANHLRRIARRHRLQRARLGGGVRAREPFDRRTADVLIAIDQPNIRFGAMRTIQRAVEAFIDRLHPSDRIAAVAIGPGSQSTPFTSDREEVKRSIERMTGNRTAIEQRAYNLSLAEALDIYQGSTAVWQSASARECAGLQPVHLFGMGSRRL